MAESLGQAQLQLTVAGYDDLIQKLANIKKELNGISSGPIKLQVDGTGTRSKTTSGDRAQGGARESSNALTNAKKTRYKLDQQIQTLERAGVNTSKLRAQLGEATTAQARRQFGSFKQIAGSLQFALTKEKDRLRVQKELNAEKAKDTRVRPISFDGGARESITARTDAQSKRARLNQQLNSLEASGVKTTKLRAQLGEATTAQANRQFGTFNQIANSLGESLKKEREKLKIQRQQSNELKGQVTEEKRIGKLNASPVRGGEAFRGSPRADAALAAEGKRIGGLNASPVRGGIAFKGSPVSLEVAARAEQRLAKERAAAAAATQKAADRDNANNKRIAKGNASSISGSVRQEGSPAFNAARERRDRASAAEGRRIGALNASPVGGGAAFRGSPKANAALDAEGKRVGGLNASPVRGGIAFKGSPIALEVAARAENKLTQARQRATEAALKTAAAEAKQSAAQGKNIGRLNTSPVRGGVGFPGSPIALEKAQKEKERLAKQQKQERGARLNSGLVGGAFPLMFGQGGFAALGGAIGGSAGGGELGFGLSLVGTAIGSQIDELNKRFEGLGVALRSPIESLDVFIEQATLASSAQDKLVKSLVDAGQFGNAEELLRSESARTVDPLIAEGVAANNEKYNRALSDTRDLLGQITSGPTSAFLSFLAGVLNTVNNVPEADPEAPAGDRLAATKKKATEDKQKGQRNAALGLALGISNPFSQVQGLVGQGQASFSEGTERAASSKEVLALETKLTKQKQNQKALEAASLVAKREGRSELAAALTAQAKLSALSVEQTAGESAIQQQLARDKDGINDDKDKSKSLDDISALRERIKLQKELIKVESAADARNSTLAANKAKQLQGLEGTGRSIRERELDVERARADTKRASELLGRSTPGEKQVAENTLTTAKNTQFVAQLALEREQLTVRRELDKSLQSELIIRQGIAKQITAAIAGQGAALARADAGANPGNSVLAARAGRAEGDAFKAQNQSGINAAKDNESQLRNQLRFEVDPSKQTELVDKIRTAAEATKLAYIEAGTALAEKIGAAAATLQGAKEGMRGLLEGNIKKLPGQDQINLKREALGDVQRGVQKGILRPNINFNSTQSLLENSRFVRDVEQNQAKQAQAEAQIRALTDNTAALQQGTAINVTVNSDGAGGWTSGGAERIAA